MKEELFAQLFPLPYEHSKWLADQATLIKRLKKTKDKYLLEQAKKLESHQKAYQCSILMMDIVSERVERHEKSKETKEKKDLTTEAETGINSL